MCTFLGTLIVHLHAAVLIEGGEEATRVIFGFTQPVGLIWALIAANFLLFSVTCPTQPPARLPAGRRLEPNRRAARTVELALQSRRAARTACLPPPILASLLSNRSVLGSQIAVAALCYRIFRERKTPILFLRQHSAVTPIRDPNPYSRM